ncbi:hypothetical protein Tco_0880566 [Tanacetum coccineum]
MPILLEVLEDKVGIIEHGLPKKMCDPGNYVFPVKINGVVKMNSYQTKIENEVNTLARRDGEEVKNVEDFPPQMVISIRGNYGAIIDMGRGTLCIDDMVICNTYFPKPRSKSYVEAFEMEGEDDWLGSFEVGRDKDRNMIVMGLEVGWIWRIQELDTAYWGFLGVGTTLDIFQNIILIPYLEYGVLILSEYGILIFIPLWSLVSACMDTRIFLDDKGIESSK